MDERWALIRSAMEDQASGVMHVDPGTMDHVYTRAEVEELIAMTAALLCVTVTTPSPDHQTVDDQCSCGRPE